MRVTSRVGWRVWPAAAVLAACLLAVRGSSAGDPSNERPSTLFPGHGSTIAALAITPDGKTLATGSLDNTIKLWDLDACRERTTLRGHPGGIQAMALTRDGILLASASHDDFVKLWDSKSGQDKGTIKTGYRVWCLAFSPDGRTVMTGGHAPIKLWDVATGKECASLDPGPSKTDGTTLLSTSLVVTADGKTLYSGHMDGTVRAWDLPTGRVRTILRVGRVNDSLLSPIALSPDEKTLACAIFGGPLALWDLPSGKRRAWMPRERAMSYSVAFSPSGRILASGGTDGKIRLWDVATGRQRLAFLAHGRWVVNSLAFTPDGKTLYSGSGREVQWGDVQRWDVAAFETPVASK